LGPCSTRIFILAPSDLCRGSRSECYATAGCGARRGEILEPSLKGLDLGTAAEQLLNGMDTSYLLLA
jgi:hypothetical protein